MLDRIAGKHLLSGKPIRISKPELLPAPLDELRTLLVMPLSTKNSVLGLIAHRLFAACDQFSDGRANDDDMTIVVARIRSEQESELPLSLN